MVVSGTFSWECMPLVAVNEACGKDYRTDRRKTEAPCKTVVLTRCFQGGLFILFILVSGMELKGYLHNAHHRTAWIFVGEYKETCIEECVRD